MPEPTQVRSMFGRIARRYDLLNFLLSGGFDRRWRARAVRDAGESSSGRVVDACSGTGDLALAYAREGARVLGVDFTWEMIVRAGGKLGEHAGRVVFAHGDALRLPAPDDCADVSCVAFGIRNVADRRALMREMRRVVRPGGRVQILEFSMPPGRLLGPLYRFYFTRILPVFGRLVSKDAEAYSYLPRTVLAWPAPDALAEEMREEGLIEVAHRSLTFGIVHLHTGRVPGA